MLVDSMEAAGLNSGLMMPQYTAASLVLENQTLATPDSVHSFATFLVNKKTIMQTPQPHPAMLWKLYRTYAMFSLLNYSQHHAQS